MDQSPGTPLMPTLLPSPYQWIIGILTVLTLSGGALWMNSVSSQLAEVKQSVDRVAENSVDLRIKAAILERRVEEVEKNFAKGAH